VQRQKLSRIARELAPYATLLAMLIAFRPWVTWHPAFMERNWSAVYRQAGGTWQRLPELPGRAISIRISPEGVVWALTYDARKGDLFVRFDGATWKTLASPEKFWISSSEFALDGREIWAAAHKGVVHWDGRRWETYPTVPADVVTAAHGRAWALNSQGRLSRFEAGKWTTLDLAPPAENSPEDENWDDAKLLSTDDGTVWLARRRLWRTDGKQWNEIDAGADYPALLGAVGNRVWVWEGRSLRTFSTNGEPQTHYSRIEARLLPGEGVYDALSQGNLIYLAASHGVVVFDGANWTRVSGPRAGVRSIRGVAIGAEGELWTIGTTPNPMWRYTRFLATGVPIAMLLGILAVGIWMVRRFKRDRLTDSQHMQRAAELAIGAAPEHLQRAERRLKRESTWLGASVAVILPVAALIAYMALQVIWRKAPPWTFLALAVVIHGIHVLWKSLMKRKPKPWDPIEPGGPGYDWSEVRRALPGTLGIFLLMNLDSIWRSIGDPFPWILGGFWAWVAYRFLTAALINKALRRADYDEAGKVVRKMRFHSPEGTLSLRLRGTALVFAGSYREAEDILRRAVAEIRDGAQQAHALDYLGNALMEMGRYDEAQRTFEAAVQAKPGFRRPYIGMAEILLRQHKDPPKALEYVEQIVGPDGPSWNKWGVNGEVRDDYWAVKAWALAELGRGAEVAPAIERAIHFTNPKSRPALATTYYRAGMAAQTMGDEKMAFQYFERAREADPDGRAGKLAKAALGEHSVFRS
jgi:tetratricopeptide (TPR) repeat protein